MILPKNLELDGKKWPTNQKLKIAFILKSLYCIGSTNSSAKSVFECKEKESNINFINILHQEEHNLPICWPSLGPLLLQSFQDARPCKSTMCNYQLFGMFHKKWGRNRFFFLVLKWRLLLLLTATLLLLLQSDGLENPPSFPHTNYTAMTWKK